MSLTTTAAQGRTQDAPAGLDRIPQRIFLYRLLGMGLGAICIASVLYENGVSPLVWALCGFTGLLWPHLALAIATRSASPYRAEVRNLLIDSAIAGAWVGLMQFNLLPSVLLFTLVTMDKISTGIPKLWLWSLPAFAAGLLCGALATGFAIQPVTSMAVMLGSLPVLMIHTIAVGLGSNRLVQKIGEKNRQLDHLSRTDSLTGLSLRRHWHALATDALARHQESGEPATLLMLDVDHFKLANDRHGHAVGDEVMRTVAAAIAGHMRENDHAGRYGGDEFGIVLSATDAIAAQTVADNLLDAIRGIQLAAAPDVRISASIGMAEAVTRYVTVEQWIEAADAALYRAKHAGRDRVEG